MEDDLIASLTQQVKEEVIENYLTERRIVGQQIEDIQQEADAVRFNALKTGRRLNRLAYLTIHQEMMHHLMTLLGISENTFWAACLKDRFARRTRFIRVRAFTDKGRFKKLMVESYSRLYVWMEKYRAAYEELSAECRAVNMNIDKFQKNFDLLTILNFLKNLDTSALERKHFLGENFTAAELASVDKQLYLRQISFESLDVPPPLELPKPESVEDRLSSLAGDIYRKYERDVKGIML